MISPDFKIYFVYYCWRMIRPSLFQLDLLLLSSRHPTLVLLYHVKISGYVGTTAGFSGTATSYICVKALIIAATTTSPKRLMTYFAIIRLNIKYMAVCKYDTNSSLSFFLVFIRNCLCLT